MYSEVIEFDLRGLLAVLDSRHSRLFTSWSTEYDRRARKTKKVDEVFCVDLSEDKIGVGVGSLITLQQMNPLYRFKVREVISGLPVSKLSIADTGSVSLRWYQQEALNSIASARVGIVEIPTGGGKTLVMLTTAMSARDSGNVLIIVPTKTNQEEVYKNAESLDLEVRDYISGRDKLDKDKGVIYLGSARSISNDLRSGSNKDVIDSITTVLWDEVHHIQSPTYHNVLLSLTNLSRSIGFSGTPLDDESKSRRFSSYAEIPVRDALVYSGGGPIIYSIHSSSIGSYIDKPTVLEIPFKWTNTGGLEFSNDWHRVSKKINSNINRIEYISKLICRLDAIGKSTICPVENKQLGVDIAARSELGSKIICWYGNEEIFYPDSELRISYKETIDRINKGDIQHVVATSHMNESANLPDMSVCILHSGRKARLSRQRAGRVARVGNSKSYVINVRDSLPLLESQSRSRSRGISEYFGSKIIRINNLDQLVSYVQRDGK